MSSQILLTSSENKFQKAKSRAQKYWLDFLVLNCVNPNASLIWRDVIVWIHISAEEPLENGEIWSKLLINQGCWQKTTITNINYNLFNFLGQFVALN